MPAAAAAQHPAPRFTKEQILTHDRQEVKVADFPAAGLILDIGGGGEGVIAQLKGQQVVAIDPIARELKEASGDPLLQIVMDATDLKFLDASFSTITSFFTLMYIPLEKQAKVFEEAARVLKPGGRFHIWDVEIPAKPDPVHEVVAYRFLFKLPGFEVSTGYGTLFADKPRTPRFYAGLASSAGFRILSETRQGDTFALVLEKA
jgi:ubiquinone/menaquinone biosynthesis C-methylase UbiE